MFKNKQFWMGFLLAVVVMVALGEIQRSNNRADAVSDLNTEWSTLKTDAARTEALKKADIIVGQNMSIFNFSNSHADEGGKEPEEYGGGVNDWSGNSFSLQRAGVTDTWVVRCFGTCN